MAALQGVVRAPLLFGLDDSLVRPLAETFAVVGRAVGHDLPVKRNLAFGKGFQHAFVVILGVGETYPAVGFGITRTSSLWGEVDSLSAQGLARVRHPCELALRTDQTRAPSDRSTSFRRTLFANTPPMIEAVR